MRSRQPFCRGRSAFVAGLALVGLNNAAQATIGSEYATSITLPLAQFPIDNEADASSSSLPIVLAQAGPAAGGGAPAAGGGAAPAGGANPGGAGAAPGAGGNANTLAPLGSYQDNPYGVSTSGLPTGTAVAGQPAWEIVGRVGDDEIVSDNVTHTHSNQKSDLISQFSAGVTVTADTPRLEGTLGYNALYRYALSVKNQNRFSQFGAMRAHTTLVPDYFTVDLFGNVSELERLGLGLTNSALLTNSETTQTYTLGISPDVRSQVGRLGFVDLNYYYSQLWTDRNTGPIVTPFGTIGALTGSKRQQARAMFQMPGTLDARLQTTVSVDGSEMTTGGGFSTFRRASAMLGNEFQLTRSFSLIGQGGYETLSNKQIFQLNGDGAIWDAGGRWQPNIDSSLLLLYGRHELNDDFSSQWEWQITPITEFSGRYTDGVGNPQSSLLSGGLGSGLGGGFGSGFLSNPILNTPLGPVTLPVLNFPNSQTQQNSIFRHKLLTAELSTTLDGHEIHVTAFRSTRASFSSKSPGQDTSTGIYFVTSEPITQDLTANLRLGYANNSLGNSNSYNVGFNVNYHMTETLDGSIGYDFARRDVAQKSLGFTSNTITFRLRKAIQS